METPDQPVAPVEVPAVEPTPNPAVSGGDAVSSTSFENLTVNVRRNTTSQQWEAYVTFGGIEWILSGRKLGDVDEDLQEAATPGFREKQREYYEREVLGLR
jgi:hypothetical protein